MYIIFNESEKSISYVSEYLTEMPRDLLRVQIESQFFYLTISSKFCQYSKFSKFSIFKSGTVGMGSLNIIILKEYLACY